MRSRRLVGGAAAIGIVAALSATTAANAQPSYPITLPSLSVSATTVTAGDAVALTGRNWLPNSTVTVTVTAGLPPGVATSTTAAVERRGTVRPADAVTTRDEPGEPDAQERGYGGGLPQVRTAPVNAAGEFAVALVLRHPGYNTITVTGRDANGDPATEQVVVCVTGRPHHHRHHHHRHHHGYHGDGASYGGGGGWSYGENSAGRHEHAGGRELPNTGVPVRGASVAGLGLLTVGTALAVVSRRRRARTSG